jgi:hypothetical protein
MKHTRLLTFAASWLACWLTGSRAFQPLAPTTALRRSIVPHVATTSTDPAVAADPFSSYRQTNDQALAYRDTLLGTGDVAEKGNVITVAYKGRLMSTGAQFDEGTGYGFRLGEGKVIPGW